VPQQHAPSTKSCPSRRDKLNLSEAMDASGPLEMSSSPKPIASNPRPIDPGVSIGHVHLKVADLNRAIAFYCGVLGFDLMERYGLGRERGVLARWLSSSTSSSMQSPT
jgi:catechol-2,3-dioxygenase